MEQCHNLPEIISFQKNFQATSSNNKKEKSYKGHILLGLNCHRVDLDVQRSENIVLSKTPLNQSRC